MCAAACLEPFEPLWINEFQWAQHIGQLVFFWLFPILRECSCRNYKTLIFMFFFSFGKLTKKSSWDTEAPQKVQAALSVFWPWDNFICTFLLNISGIWWCLTLCCMPGLYGFWHGLLYADIVKSTETICSQKVKLGYQPCVCPVTTYTVDLVRKKCYKTCFVTAWE